MLARAPLSLKQYLQLEVFRLHKKSLRTLHTLSYLMWECTLRCNLSCRHCGSDCSRDSKIADMPLADFLSVLDSIAAYRAPESVMVGLTGGEPLLRRDLEELGQECRTRGFPWGLVTNGLLLDEARFSRLLDSGLGSLSVSLDGLEAEHNWLRRNPQSFQMALRAVKMAAQAPLTSDVITCVHRHNLHILPDIEKLLVDIGLRNWRIFTIFPRGRAENAQELGLEAGQFRQVMEFIHDVRQRGNIHLQYACEGYLGEFEGLVRDEPFFCRAGINFASVLCDGSISGCPSIRGGFTQGSIYSDDFYTVWENKFNELRRVQRPKTGLCAQCSSWRYCEGNGAHLHRSPSDNPSICHLSRLQEKGIE